MSAFRNSSRTRASACDLTLTRKSSEHCELVETSLALTIIADARGQILNVIQRDISRLAYRKKLFGHSMILLTKNCDFGHTFCSFNQERWRSTLITQRLIFHIAEQSPY